MAHDLDADDAASLLRELAWLRKRQGFTAARLTRAPIVDEVLRGAASDSFERLRHRFISAMHNLDEDMAALLLPIFALTPATAGSGSLLERRARLAQQLGCSPETVATREEAGLRLLHGRLIAGRYAQAPLVLDVPEMHGGVIYEETTTLVVVAQRHWQHTWERYRLANLGEPLDYLEVARSYPARVTPDPAGAFAVTSAPVPGAGWRDRFWHRDPASGQRRPLPSATRATLTFRLDPLPDDPDSQRPIRLTNRAFHTRSLLATIRVRFLGPTPRAIWSFHDTSPFAQPHTVPGAA